MPVYGYDRRVVDAKTGLLQMREISFALRSADLRAMAAFLADCADRIDRGQWRSDHDHMPEAPRGVDVVVCHRPTR